MQSANDLEPLRIHFPDCEESESSCGESTEAEDLRRGGYHPGRVGETFKSGRYRALCRLGSGHFSTVWLCFDSAKSRYPGEPLYHGHNSEGVTANGQNEMLLLEAHNHGGSGDAQSRAPRGKVVALKIQKSAADYTDAARDEIRILESIRRADPQRMQPVVTLLDHFEHNGVNGRHVCLVFDMMGVSLLHLIKRFNFRGIPVELVKRVTRDLLVGLDFLHTQAFVIHTDLKPENILMRLPASMLRELDVRGYEFNRELVDRKLGRNNGSSARASLTHSDHPMSSPGLRETKAQKKRRRRKFKAQAQRNAIVMSERVANAWQEITPTLAQLQEDDSDGEVGARGDHGDLGDEGGLWNPSGHPGPNGGERGMMPRDMRMHPFRHGPHNGNLGELEFNWKELIDVNRVFAAGRVAIVDLGNACWINHQFTGDIQTRQYRSPEVIIGAPYGTPADMFSVACLVFELLTGEYLFNPKLAPDYNRDEDHLARMMELLGPMPRYLTSRGRYARDFFTRNGELRNGMYPRDILLHKLLIQSFEYPQNLAEEIESFLLPMLEFDPQKRATAEKCLHHPFLKLRQ